MVSIKDVRRYIEMAPQGDDVIDLHLEMFRFQQKVLQQQMAELQHTMEIAEYKCRYYETVKACGTIDAPQNMDESEIPKQFRRIRRDLRKAADS